MSAASKSRVRGMGLFHEPKNFVHCQTPGDTRLLESALSVTNLRLSRLNLLPLAPMRGDAKLLIPRRMC